MTTDLDPLLPEAEVDAADRPAIDWPTDPWDNSDRTGTVERLRRQTRPLKWAVYSVLCLSIVAIMIAGAVGWWYLQRLNPPGDPGPVEGFTVAEGETLESLSERLEDEGFVEDAGVFVQYVENKVGDDDEFEIVPGFYELRPGDHVGNVMGRLGVPPAQTSRSVTFPEGFTLAQMARRVGTEFETLSADGFTAATQDEYILPWEPPGGAASLEGLLFPDTYDVSNADSEGQLVQRMIDIMQRVGNQEDIVTKGAALGRTPYEILIIASMIEKEAKVPEDRATHLAGHPQPTLRHPEQPRRRAVPAADRRGRALRPQSARYRPGHAVLRGPTDAERLEHLSAPGPAEDADRQPRPSVDRSGTQPGTESGAG